jgi:hypothetical protein
MWKYMAVLAVIFALAIYVAVQDQHSATKSANQSTPPPNTAVAIDAHNNRPQNHAENAERNSPRWHRLFAWPEGITTWAIILTLLAIAEQAGESAKSTRAVRDSLPLQKTAADAALANAQAVINAERPWIAVNIGKGRVLAETTLVLKNWGRTPAKIVSIKKYRRVVRTQGEKGQVIEVPRDEHNIVLVPPGEPLTFEALWLSEHFSQAEIKEMEEGGNAVACYFGRIEYLDVFLPDQTHITDYCYSWDLSMRAPMPSNCETDYNHYT